VRHHAPDQGVTDGVQVRPPVVIHHPFRVACRPRRVVQTDSGPLVGRPLPLEISVPLAQELFILGVATDAVGGLTGRPHDVGGVVVDDHDKGAEAAVGLVGVGQRVFCDAQELPALRNEAMMNH
jgi:hypothetical protein